MIRLEQQDAYLTEFDAAVRSVEREGRPGRGSGPDLAPALALVRLDRSAFYPTAGGQPHDVGSLRGPGGVARVIDVRAEGPGVVHVVEGAAEAGLEPGARVRGVIDWERRYRHMQRHTAQHLLSQAFVRVDERFATRSVALTSPDLTLDLAGDPDDAALAEAARVVQEAGWAALPVRAFEVDEAEVGAWPLRRPPKVTGRIRLVDMGGWELSACGGTHLRTSAEALPVLLTGRQAVRGGLVRVSFRAGREALELANGALATLDGVARSFSSRPEEVPERVAALRAEAAEAERRADALARRWAAEAAARLAAAAPDGVVAHRLPDGDAALLAPLADALDALPGVRAALGAAQDGRARVLTTRAPDAPGDAGAALRAALERVDGRGGGRPERAQGAGSSPERLDDALAAAAAALRA